LFAKGRYDESIEWFDYFKTKEESEISRNAATLYQARAHLVRGRVDLALRLLQGLPGPDAAYFLGLAYFNKKIILGQFIS